MPATPELLRALGVLCEPPEPTHARIAEALCLPGRIDAADHTELFGFQLVPYASVYLGAEAMLGLYATIGEAERGERDRARQALWRQARRALLWEHLLTWAVTYARAVIGSAPPFHAAWAQLLERTLLAEAADLEPPATPPLHLRDAPGLPEAGEDADALVGVLLAPARSGLILTRW